MYFKKNRIIFIVAMALVCFSPSFVFSQRKKDKKKAEEAKSLTENKDVKSITELTKKSRKIEGLFTIYQDSVSGSCYLLVKKEQLEREFIYFCHIADGVLASGSFRGSYRGSNIFTVKKYFNKIEFITKNTAYYFDKSNPISKAADANISDAVMISQSIIAEDKTKGEYLVKADDIFLTEALQQVKPSASSIPGMQIFSLGSLNKEKTKYESIKSYPLNTDMVVKYVYDNLSPTVRGGEDLADDRYVSVKVQHSFIQVPQNNFKPRYDDPRIGFFTTQMNDMTSVSATPYKDMIHHWNLEKKDKNAFLSDPVTPIVWWIENTTPVEYRETIKTAALKWNEAFEFAGFKNAIEVKIQPDDADWDAGDIRYNVLRWTSSPNPPFGGYGPSFTNPRTGEILGADIMLEYVFVTNRLRFQKLFEAGNLNVENIFLEKEPDYCTVGENLHQSTLFGLQSLLINNSSDEELSEFIKSALYYLVLHEMGHTLGLMHNMKSSQLYSPAEINNKELTLKTGLIGSVMDYPAVNISPDRKNQGQYFTTKPGPYDKWAIEYGYSQSLDNEMEEQKRLEKILSRSTEPALTFGNDADDMRFPGKGIDPRVMIGDMSNDAISYSVARINLIGSVMEKIKDKYSKKDQSYHELNNAYNLLLREHATATGVISRYIGGVYVDRSFVGQAGGTKPFVPVPYKDQKRAMEALSKYLFGAKTFSTHNDLYGYLQIQRRGFGFFGSNEDPKIHDWVLNMQSNILTHFLNTSTLKRITDTELYGNEYKFSEFFNDLTNAIFKEDLQGKVNTFRQNLQKEYINRLIIISKNSANIYDYHSETFALNQLRNIEKTLKVNVGVDEETKAHRSYILYKINKELDGK